MTGSMTKNALKSVKEAVDVRERLIDAAEELFAGQGFDGTSIRDLIAKAKSNLSSVNYHFGDKKVLYEELFRQRLCEMRESRLKAISQVMAGRGKPTLEKLLHAYSIDFLRPFSDAKRSQRFMRLFFREMAERRLPKNMFLDEMAAPVMTAMEKALAVLCPDVSKHDIEMSVISITGQLVHIMQVRVLFEGAKGHPVASIDIDDAIDHIVKFSAAGIRGCAKRNSK